MKTIINIAQPQCGKTTKTLSETELYPEMKHFNLVYNYNAVVEDVLKKAKPYNFTCEAITRKLASKWRKEVVMLKPPTIADMSVGIMDHTRGEMIDPLLSWLKHRKIPVRIIIDEYDVFQVGFTDERKIVQRDEVIEKYMAGGYASIIEFNSATNISGVISNYTFDDVQKVDPYPGYCGWDSLDIQSLDDKHFIDFLNGEVSPELIRKLNQATSNNNILLNLSSKVAAHDSLNTAIKKVERYDTMKINYESDDDIVEIPEKSTVCIGGQVFGRSVTVPNLAYLAFYRKSVPHVAALLQALGRVLGNRNVDPIVITTPKIKKVALDGIKLETAIQEEGILSCPPTERLNWLKSKVQTLSKEVRIFNSKSNGIVETKSPQYVETDDVTGLYKFDHWYEIDMPKKLWEDWETKSENKRTSKEMYKLCEQAYPHIKDIEGVIDERDGPNAARRRYIAVRENLEGGYNRYVYRKGSGRKLPILFGRQRGKSGKGFLILRDKDIEKYSDKCWHHNEYGKKMKLIEKSIYKKPNVNKQ